MKKFIKRCRDCGGLYDTRDRTIKIKLNHKDIERLEDAIFCKYVEEDYLKIIKKANKIWVQVCEEEEKWPKY